MRILTPESDILKRIPGEFLTKFPDVNIADLKYFTKPAPPRTILVSSELQPNQVVEQFISSDAAHLVQHNELFFLKDLETTAALITQPKLYFESFGGAVLSKIIKSKTILFSSPEDKAALLVEASTFIAEAKSNSLSDSAYIVLEELYMNAVFSAPMESQNKLSGNKSAKFNLLLSEDYLVISCIDQYGSLDPAQFLNRLREVYRLGVGNSIRMNAGKGAGIGCMLLFEQCSGLYFGIVQNVTSIVTAVIPRELGNKQRLDIKKSLHVLQFSK